MAEATFIIPIIRDDFIKPCLDSLYKYTPIKFNVIVIDNTLGDEAEKKCKGLYHLWIKSYRNLGFSKSINTGILLSQTPYIVALNDDVVFIDSRWWQGVLDTFAMDEKILVVNPNSPKEGAWGYGLTNENKDTWKPREGFVFDGDKSVLPVINGKPFEYKREFSKEDYDSLLNNHPVWSKDTLCDGLACWCTVFKRETLEEFGLFDEKFYPGGGEDYDMMARIYSKDKRAVGTTLSWAWHHWGKSKDDISGKQPDSPLFSRPRWNNLTELWGDKFDVWGHWDNNGVRTPLKRLQEVHVDDL